MPNEKLRKKDSARLVWDTKPRRAPNPKDIEFQTAELVIPNPKVAGELPLSFRDGLFGDTDIDKQKMNRLIWGDNLLAMQALLAQGYEGKINLIYIDPPFDSKADYSHKMTVNPSPSGRGLGEGFEFTKEPSVIERLAYKDTWAGGTDSYLDMLYPRLQLMKRLLVEDGSIYVHIGPNISHYIKVMLDEVFGKENFSNEIIWKRTDSHNDPCRYGVIHDLIYFYTKGDNWIWNPDDEYQPLPKDTIENWYSNKEIVDKDTVNKIGVLIPKGSIRYFNKADITGAGANPKDKPFKGVMPPSGRHWAYKIDVMEELDREGRIYYSKSGKPYEKRYLDESKGIPPQSIWTDISMLRGMSKHAEKSEWTDFDTQKPMRLIERVVNISSYEGDLVADFFCGSGTTLAVAEKLGRQWIGCELGKVGIQVARARLVEQRAKPFLIENIGNYQREMIYLTGGRIWEMQQLILKLYGATPRDKTSGLGIRKDSGGIEELVYVGYPDRPVTARKAEELALQAQKLDGRGYKRLIILGWDYEYNYHQALESRMKPKNVGAHGYTPKVEIISRDIPPDIYDYLKKAKTEEDIEALSEKVKFYERPYLKMDTPKIEELKDGNVAITLNIKRYVLMDIPISQTSKKGQEDYTALMKIAKDNFAVLIDYWAVDWDYDGFTFKSHWQAFRGNGKKAKTVATEAKEILDLSAERAGRKKRTIAVRVVDIFGNDAGLVMEVLL
jgi:Adenine specific DNA methylase Mod